MRRSSARTVLSSASPICGETAVLITLTTPTFYTETRLVRRAPPSAAVLSPCKAQVLPRDSRSGSDPQKCGASAGGTSEVHNLFLRPLIHPIVHRLVPKLRILRLQHPVAFGREIKHLRRHAFHLQRREQLEALAHVEPVVPLPMHDQRRRLEILRVLVRRP